MAVRAFDIGVADVFAAADESVDDLFALLGREEPVGAEADDE